MDASRVRMALGALSLSAALVAAQPVLAATHHHTTTIIIITARAREAPQEEHVDAPPPREASREAFLSGRTPASVPASAVRKTAISPSGRW